MKLNNILKILIIFFVFIILFSNTMVFAAGDYVKPEQFDGYDTLAKTQVGRKNSCRNDYSSTRYNINVT